MCSVSLNHEIFSGQALSMGNVNSLPETVLFWRSTTFDSARHRWISTSRNYFYVNFVAWRSLNGSGRVTSNLKASQGQPTVINYQGRVSYLCFYAEHPGQDREVCLLSLFIVVCLCP